MRSISSISSDAKEIAFTPSCGRLEFSLAPGHNGAIGVDAFMRVDHCHTGELANDDDAGARQVGSEPGDQRTDAGAANLLVIGDDDVDRLL